MVLTRNVDPGNAVAASLQAVTLFTVAEDLAQLRLQVYVDEADVGSVQGRARRPASPSAPTRAASYPATITRVAYGSTITDNVVTYLTYLDVDNSDLSLRPGMTATATITATAAQRRAAGAQHRAALHAGRRPPRRQPAASGGIVVQPDAAHAAAAARARPAAAGASTATARQVWVLRDGAAVPVAVTPGHQRRPHDRDHRRRAAGRHAGHHRPEERRREMRHR